MWLSGKSSFTQGIPELIAVYGDLTYFSRMKTILIATLLFVGMPVFAQQDAQIVFATERLKAIPKADVSEIETLCLTVDEFLELAHRVVGKGNKSEQDIMADVRKQGDAWKKQYAKDYYQAFTPLFLQAAQCDSIDWSNIAVDSILYVYRMTQEGKDERINWPESQTFVIPTNRFVVNETAIYFHNEKHSYLVNFYFVFYNGSWRLTRGTKIPRVMRTDK